MYRKLRNLLGRVRWSAADIYRELFIEVGDRHRLERALRKLHNAAHRRPLRDSGRKIVFFSLRPWFTFLAHEGVMAARFRHEGHDVSYYTCRDDLAFCMGHNINGPEEYRNCGGAHCLLKDKWIDPRYPIHTLGPMSDEAQDQCRLIDGLELEDCATYHWRDLLIGDLCASSVNWYLRRTKFNAGDVVIWRKFLKSAVHVADRFALFLEQSKPDVVVLLMGAFFTEAMALELCRRQDVRTVTYGVASAGRLLIGHNMSIWEARDLDRIDLDPIVMTPDIIRKGRSLLERWRKGGGGQGFLFWQGKKNAPSALRDILGDDPRPLAVAYTNTTYETAILRKKRIFNDQFEWAALLADYFRAHPEYRLIIRVHPAENVRDEWKVAEWFLDRMKDYITAWPSNVTVIPPESLLSSYELADACRVGLTYVSTIGMELVYRGIPVITAGSCHYDNRGFTCDPKSKAEYIGQLERHLNEQQSVQPSQRDALIRYISWSYFIRLADFEPIEQGRRESYLKCRKIKPRQVFSGRLKGLESLCSLILDGREWWTVDEMVKSGVARRLGGGHQN